MVKLLEIPDDKNISVVVRPALSDLEFEKLCAANPDLNLERTKEGAIVVNAPTSSSTGDANSEINAQLRVWWWTHSTGKVYDSSTGVLLPDCSAKSPDAAYATEEQISDLTEDELSHFLGFVPAFVLELRSPTDGLNKCKENMERWIENGALLAWLVDPKSRSVTIYEKGYETRIESESPVRGTGPIEGFALHLDRVWAAYRARR
jgi:Uma2 family endonuclease